MGADAEMVTGAVAVVVDDAKATTAEQIGEVFAVSLQDGHEDALDVVYSWPTLTL